MIRSDVTAEPQSGKRSAQMPDGRRVRVTEYGAAEGRPVFLLHGAPLSALGYSWFVDGPARERGVRVLCPDRPGIGRSDRRPGRSLGDCADDVVRIADAVGVERFAVLGHSCGAPFALAVAARFAGRVSRVALVAGAGPVDTPEARAGLAATDRQLLGLSLRRPWAASVQLQTFGLLTRLAPARALAAMTGELSDPDQRILTPHGLLMVASFVESVRHGARGVVDDYRCWGTPWGFALAEVRAPVHLWQGDADWIIPMAHAERMARELPHAVLHEVPGEGHFSIARQMGPILDQMIS